MITCPVCEGRKQVFCAIDYADRPGTMSYAKCYECGGSGEITEERQDRITKGNALREARVARGETLREGAKAMGITSLELSRMEQGK